MFCRLYIPGHSCFISFKYPIARGSKRGGENRIRGGEQVMHKFRFLWLMWPVRENLQDVETSAKTLHRPTYFTIIALMKWRTASDGRPPRS